VCARAIPADPRSPPPPSPPSPCPLPPCHPPSPFPSLCHPLLFPRQPRRGADRPDRPDCRDVFCIELTKCTSRIFIAPTNIAGRGRVTDARLHFGNARKTKGKEILRSLPPETLTKAHADSPNGPLCIGCSVCGYPSGSRNM